MLTQGLAVGSIGTIICNAGFEMRGLGRVTCEPNYTWRSYGSCVNSTKRRFPNLCLVLFPSLPTPAWFARSFGFLLNKKKTCQCPIACSSMLFCLLLCSSLFRYRFRFGLSFSIFFKWATLFLPLPAWIELTISFVATWFPPCRVFTQRLASNRECPTG